MILEAWVSGFFSFVIGSGLILGQTLSETLFGVGVGIGVIDGLAGCCLRGFCCGCVARCFLPKRKPQLGQRPDALLISTPHCGQLLGFFIECSMFDGRGIAAHLDFRLIPFSDCQANSWRLYLYIGHLVHLYYLSYT